MKLLPRIFEGLIWFWNLKCGVLAESATSNASFGCLSLWLLVSGLNCTGSMRGGSSDLGGKARTCVFGEGWGHVDSADRVCEDTAGVYDQDVVAERGLLA